MDSGDLGVLGVLAVSAVEEALKSAIGGVQQQTLLVWDQDQRSSSAAASHVQLVKKHISNIKPLHRKFAYKISKKSLTSFYCMQKIQNKIY